MKLLAAYKHPLHGRVYLWGDKYLHYHLGTVYNTIKIFVDQTLEEVQEALADEEFYLEDFKMPT